MSAPGRVLGVDYGKRRIGFAVSDETASLARPLETAEVTGRRAAAEVVAETAKREGARVVVLGDPRHMDGRESTLGEEIRLLARRIEALLPGVAVVLWDERLTSHEAAAILRERGERPEGRKGRLDQVAAAVLLQSYLDAGCP
ncbi:MAG: Holliday junction resolvase RuvX [Acidobacteriota bacterium]